VHFSWGHDEYLYQVMRPYLRGEALAILRYHSCYSWHSGGAYRELMDDCDHAALPWVQRFSPYDLYSKRDALPDWERQRSYYRELVAEFLPESLDW
jgi:inositol oxygenase